MKHIFFITCPKGLEPLLFEELQTLGVQYCKQSVAGVYANDDLAAAYKICLWSRLANRVLLKLISFPCPNAAALYNEISKIDWLKHMHADGSLAIDFNGTSETMNNSLFGAQKVKDAIVDQIRNKTKTRPNIDKNTPDLRVNVRLFQNEATVSIDLSGDSLHRRGYRLASGTAPLKENLAAAILIRAGWNKKTFPALVDPLCGSGTLLIEGLLMAANIAPGLFRQYFGFERWLQHDETAWQKLLKEAETKRSEGLAKPLPTFIGYDRDSDLIHNAQMNVERIGLEKLIEFKAQDLSVLKNTTNCEQGLIICNPPYGERLEDAETLQPLYQLLGDKFRSEFEGWNAGIFTGNEALCSRIGIRPNKKYQFFNGTIACRLFLYNLISENFFTEKSHKN